MSDPDADSGESLGDMTPDDILRETMMGGSDDEETVDRALSELLGEMSDTEKIQMFSDLTMRELRHLSVMRTLGDDMTQNFVKNYLMLKVSRSRRGRRELVDLADAFGSLLSGEDEAGGLLEKIGLRR